MFVEASGFPSKAEPFETSSKVVDLENPDPKSHLSERSGPSNPQELTLSYMCENPKVGFLEKEAGGRNFLEAIEKARGKGKEVAPEEAEGEEDRRWLERDFLQLGGGGGRSGGNGKRAVLGGGEGDFGGEKRAKIETLSLSLAPPSLSLSLNPSNPVSKPVAPPVVEVPTAVAIKRSQSNNTFNTRASSDDFGVSLSQSCSHAFSHNPSCSLTRNSTDFEYSKETDHIWCAGGGEGTNGSVHSRFKPIGDNNNSITFSNHNGYPRLQSNNNKEISNGFHRVNSFENSSFFPSELPARPRKEFSKDVSDGARNSMLTRPEKILREILSESVPVVAQIFQELLADSIEATKDYLRTLMSEPDKKEDFSNMQRRLERRSDLTFETLLKSHKSQLDILVAVKTGLITYLSMKNRLPTKELVEIFLLTRCRNVNCKSILPIDDCDCKICSNKKGFCSSCMCPVCMNFDYAENTCSWVGCDVCSHWCHAMCGIQKNLIRPGPSLKGTAGTTEMQFHCLGCGHASEMFGFVKDVFIFCAKDWGLETLKKELDCVRQIFHGSEDYKGKELQSKAEEMLTMLQKNLVSPADACDVLLQFLKYGASDLSTNGRASKDVIVATPLAVAPPKPMFNNIGSPGASRDGQKAILKAFEPSLQVSLPKTDGFESLESMVQFKQAEAGLFQRLADEARREVEAYRQIVRAKSEKLEEEYSSKLAKLCLQETEERQRKKLEELKVLENSHCDYYKMKMRMEAEMASLLERMEATKQQWS